MTIVFFFSCIGTLQQIFTLKNSGLFKMYSLIEYTLGGLQRGDSITDGWLKPDFVEEIWVRPREQQRHFNK
jgi:hypothetical protein